MFNISFDFDEVTQRINNIKVSSNVITKLPTKCKTKNDERILLEVSENKLILSDGLITALDLQVGVRVSINYYTINNQNTIPLIGKSEMFLDKETGNKLTKSKTVSFKGIQRKILSKYGTMFTIKPWNNQKGVFELISIPSEDEVISASSIITKSLFPEAEFLRDLDINDINQQFTNLTEEENLPF